MNTTVEVRGRHLRPLPPTECIAERGNGPGLDADPGWTRADMDADIDVGFRDFALFQRALTGSQ